MGALPPETLQAVSHVSFGVFNLSVPDIIAWSALIVVFCIGAWLRLPRIFQPKN